MRTTQAARYARWSAAVAISLAIAGTGLYVRGAWQARRAERELPAASVPPTVQERSAAFSLSKVEGDRTEFTVRASHATEYIEGGRSELEEVWVTVYGQDEQRFDNFHTHACEYVEPTGNLSCAGDVEIDLESAADARVHPGSQVIHIKTSHVSFNRATGLAAGDGPLTLQFPQGEGRALGFRYDAAQGELRLVQDVDVTFQGSSAPGGKTVADPPALEISSSALTYSRDAHVIHLVGPVKAHRGAQELTTGKLDVELDPDLRPRKIIASDHPELREMGLGAPVSISADELSALLSQDGSVQRVIGVGNVRADARRAEGGDHFEAGRAELELAAGTNQPRLLTANESVMAESTRPGGLRRRLVTSALEVDFAAGGGRGQVRLNRATTPAATLDWEGPADTSGRAAIERMHLRSQHLEATFTTTNQVAELRGNGDVEVGRQIAGAAPETSTSREVVARFGPDGDWSSMDQTGDVNLREAERTAHGDLAHFEHLSGDVALTGSVVLSDADSRTSARSATFDRRANEFHAEGQVVTSELSSGPGQVTNFAAEPARVSADRLVVNTITGHAVYSGRARLWQGASVVEADTIELDRAAHLLTALNRVRAIFPQAPWMPASGEAITKPIAKSEFWHAEAGRMTYASDEGRGRLDQGAVAHNDEGTIRSDSMDLFFAPAEPLQGGPRQVALAKPAVSLSAQSTAGGGRQLVRAAALGGVVVDEEGRRGTASRADYTAMDGKFVLSGGPPAVHDASGNSVTGRQLTLFFADDRILIDSAEDLRTRTLTLHRVKK